MLKTSGDSYCHVHLLCVRKCSPIKDCQPDSNNNTRMPEVAHCEQAAWCAEDKASSSSVLPLTCHPDVVAYTGADGPLISGTYWQKNHCSIGTCERLFPFSSEQIYRTTMLDNDRNPCSRSKFAALGFWYVTCSSDGCHATSSWFNQFLHF